MTDYTITTNFGAKDSLPSGNAAKVIKGSEFTTEFTNIATAVSSKADTAGDTFTGAVTINSTATITGDLTVDTDTLFVDVSEDKVGIGTASPAQALDVVGNINIQGTVPTLLFTDTDSNPDFNIIGGGSLSFRDETNSATRMLIDSSGNVGINTTSPYAKLHVAGNGKFDAGTSTVVDVLCDNGGTANIRAMGGDQGNGRIYVGQSNTYGGGIEYSGASNPALSGAGNDKIAFFRRNNGANHWTAKYAFDSNTWQFAGSITQNASDERLKENITPIENALEKVEQLRGVTFDWKDDVEEKGFIPYAKHETGVIAQDVQKVIPDAAVPAPFDENYLTVKHEKIIPLLIESIKELNKEVQALRSRVAQLEESE